MLPAPCSPLPAPCFLNVDSRSMLPAPATLAASPITAQGIDDSGHVATRVTLVARRFWPLSGTLDAGSLRLALALQARDAAVSVVSARWHAT